MSRGNSIHLNLCQSRNRKQNTPKMHSEELLKLNKALKYCDQLKSQLNNAIGHIQMLNEKYNQIDYMENIRFLEQSRSNFVPYINHLQIRLSSSLQYRSPLTINSTTDNRHHNKKVPLTSTPKLSAKNYYSFESTPIKKQKTTKRTLQEVKKNSNKITVCSIKVQRNVETMLAHLKVLQKIHYRNHVNMLEQSLYQTCNNSVSASPGKLGHFHCLENWSNNSICCNSVCMPTKEMIHSTMYATPLKRFHKRTMNINVTLLRTC